MSGVLVATAVPAFLIGPFAGVFVDRWDKRRTMLAVNLIQAIVVALLLPVTGIISPLPFLPEGTSLDHLSEELPELTGAAG
jgi:MFS family permease